MTRDAGGGFLQSPWRNPPQKSASRFEGAFPALPPTRIENLKSHMKPKHRSILSPGDSSLTAVDRKTRLLPIGFGLAAAGLLAQSALADYVWTGSAGNGLYSDPANWAGTNTDNNLIDNGQTATVDTIISWNPNDLKIASAGASLSNPTSGTVTISAPKVSRMWKCQS